jgi:hypothetical protein|tara:strand:- start:1 stop:423 length:423 start_codon:yes stop_codon:yes gene_type:complete
MSTTKTNHALNNAIGHLEEMVKDYEIGSYIEQQNVTTQEDEEKLEEIRESILNSALSVEFRSGWYSSLYDRVRIGEPAEFKILLTWGGPALRVIGEIEENYAVNPKLQFQDWGTPWTDLEITEDQQDALNWFCNCFYFGG